MTETGKEIVINLDESDEFFFAFDGDPDAVDNYSDGSGYFPLFVGDEVVIEEKDGQYRIKSINLKKDDHRRVQAR